MESNDAARAMFDTLLENCFSTFRDCMSFYTARVKLGRAAKSPPMSGLPESGRLADIGTNHILISVITAHSRNETLWNNVASRHPSGFAPENLTTLAHFSVSSAMSLLKSEGEPANTVPPRSAIRALIRATVRATLISLLTCQ